jgi:valyl-tRNA synthetase
MLDVEIDAGAELLRLSKEVERIEQEIVKCKAKLENPSFAQRAPQAVVDQERDRLLQFEQRRVALSAQYAHIKAKT